MLYFFHLTIYIGEFPHLTTYWFHSFLSSHNIPLCGYIMVYLMKALSVNIKNVFKYLYIHNSSYMQVEPCVSTVQ